VIVNYSKGPRLGTNTFNTTPDAVLILKVYLRFSPEITSPGNRLPGHLFPLIYIFSLILFSSTDGYGVSLMNGLKSMGGMITRPISG
jgi:hypothetical protein